MGDVPEVLNVQMNEIFFDNSNFSYVPEVLNVQMNEMFFPILFYQKILFQIQIKISIISF